MEHTRPAGLLPRPTHGAPAARGGSLLFISGQLGIDPHTGRVVETFAELGEAGRALGTGFLAADSWVEPFCAQAWQAFTNIAGLLAEHRATPADLLRINWYCRDMSMLAPLNPLRSRFFAASGPPANTGVEVADLPLPEAQIMIEAVGVLPGPHRREEIRSHATSQDVGNYLLATAAGPHLFASGVIAARNDTGVVIRGFADLPDAAARFRSGRPADDLRYEQILAQAWFLYEDLRQALAERGQSFADVAKLTFFVKNMSELAAVERVHDEVFPDDSPPITVVGVNMLGHRDFQLEIEMVAGVPAAGGRPERVRLAGIPTLGPEHAVATRVGGLVFTGGLCGVDPRNGRPLAGYDELGEVAPVHPTGSLAVDRREGPVVAQAIAACDQLRQVLAASGSSLPEVVKLGVYLTDLSDLPAVDRVLRALFPESPPAVTVVGVPALAVPGTRVQIDAVARTS